MSAGGGTFDWGVLVPRTIHPLKVAIIEAMEWIGQPLSPSELASIVSEGKEVFGVSHVSYHMVKLRQLGGLKVTRTERVRGATKTYYGFP